MFRLLSFLVFLTVALVTSTKVFLSQMELQILGFEGKNKTDTFQQRGTHNKKTTTKHFSFFEFGC